MKKVSKNSIKKFVGMASVVLMLGSGMTFVSCSDDSSDDSAIELPNSDSDSNKSEDNNKDNTGDNNADNNTNNGNNNNQNNGNGNNTDNNSGNDDQNNNNNQGDDNNGGDEDNTPVNALFTELSVEDMEVVEKTSGTIEAADGTWELSTSSKAIKLQALADTEGNATPWTTYDGAYTYTKKLNFGGDSVAEVLNTDGSVKTKAERILKIKLGANATKVLRIDGGSNSEGSTDGRALTVAGTKWESSYAGTKYMTVTAGEDGYITITSTKNCSIYGIHIVDEEIDTSTINVGEAKVVKTYSNPTFTLPATVEQNGAVTLDATIPEVAVKTSQQKADGSVSVTESTETADATIVYTVNDVEITEVDTSAVGDVTVKASYTIDENSYSTEATIEVTKAGVKTETVKVTFMNGSEEFDSKDVTIKIDDEDVTGDKVTLPTTNPTKAGYKFLGWSKTANSETADFDENTEIKVATTLYAVYKEQSVYGFSEVGAELTALPSDDKVVSYKGLNGVDSSDRTLDDVTYLGSIKTGGKSSSTRYIKIDVPTGKTADVSIVGSANTTIDLTKKSAVVIFVSNSATSTVPADCTLKVESTATDNLGKITGTLTAGTYYVNFTDSARFEEILVELK